MTTPNFGLYPVWKNWASATFQAALPRVLVASVVGNLNTEVKSKFNNPYETIPTGSIQTISDTYSVGAITITDESYTIPLQYVNAFFVKDFENKFSDYNVVEETASRVAEQASEAIDKFAINEWCRVALAASVSPVVLGATPAAATSDNVIAALDNLNSKFFGFKSKYGNRFLVLQQTDVVLITKALRSLGLSFGTTPSFVSEYGNTGFAGSALGIDFYVVAPALDTDVYGASSTNVYITGTYGGTTFANASLRLAGAYGVANLYLPGGVLWDNKKVPAIYNASGTAVAPGLFGEEVSIKADFGANVWSRDLQATRSAIQLLSLTAS